MILIAALFLVVAAIRRSKTTRTYGLMTIAALFQSAVDVHIDVLVMLVLYAWWWVTIPIVVFFPRKGEISAWMVVSALAVAAFIGEVIDIAHSLMAPT